MLVLFEHCTTNTMERKVFVLISLFISHIAARGIANNSLLDIACGKHQVFKTCGKCVKTCSDPNPTCTSACLAGCFCEDGYVMAPNNSCVYLQNCPQEKCSDINEEYTCRYGCEVRCVPHACVRPRRCRLGCHCKKGLYRNAQGQCVPADKCFDESKAVP
ncbi:unnamed protein product, partial [Brenthis ino]